MMVFLVLGALLLAIPVIDAIRRPDLRRVAIRNVTRRLGEASIVVFGSLLSTAIIAAAFLVGDSFTGSIRDIARTELGPVDEVVIIDDIDDLDRASELLAAPMDGVDGTLATTRIRAAIATPEGDDRRAEPNAVVGAMDFDQARGLGQHPELTGMAEAGDTPANGQVVINNDLAKELKASVGDQLTMYAYGSDVPLTVTAIMPVVGLGGLHDAYVQPGTFQALADASTADLTAAPEGAVLISNQGGLFDSTGPSGQVLRESERRLKAAGIDHQAEEVKLELLEDADEEGAELSEIFTVIGSFSVVAGILLLINLFVMLAEERKTTLGVLRAVGWRRSALVRSFALEGAIYAVVASVVGAILGIGVGWVIMQVTANILGDSGLNVQLYVEPASLLTAGAVGLVISMLAIWGTSYRISRLNIIGAIRDLPSQPSAKRRLIVTIVGTLLMIVGAALFVLVGLGGENIMAALAGPAIVFLGAALVLERWVSADRRSLGAGLATVIWGSLCMVVLPDSMTNDVDMPFFLVLGLVLVAGGVAIATTAGPMLRRLLDYSTEPRTAARVGMAYPLAHRFRTAISLASFTLVIFSMVFIAVMSRGFSNQVGDFTADADFGHDIIVRTNSSAPVAAEELRTIAGVDQVSPVVRGWTQFATPDDADANSDPDFYAVAGANAEVARFGGPVLELRSSQFATDKEAFLAVAEDPSLAIVPDWMFDDEGDGGPQPGDQIQLMLGDGNPHDLTIVGTTNFDVVNGGVWMSESFIRQELGDFSSQNLHLIKAADDASANEVASSIQGAFVVNGADAISIYDQVQEYIEQDIAFFTLLNGYLALGLVIGIAGLGVVLVRAIRERRRQIGMFRAMGMPRAGVRTTFLTEGVFVTMLAIVTGIGLGLIVANLTLTQSAAVGESTGAAMPWSSVLLISGFTLVAALIVASIPAIRASRLRPSEALRLAD